MAQPGLSILIDLSQADPEIVLEGDLDLTTAPALEQVLDCIVRSGFPVVHVDFSGVDRIELSALKVFSDLRRSCRCTVWNATPEVVRHVEGM